jgi:hypothetical protein
MHMDITVTRSEIKEYEKLKLIAERAPIAEKIKQLEKKYGCTLEEFEAELPNKEEIFEEWDDLIEWKGYTSALADLDQKWQDIENAQNIRIADE